MTKCQYKYKYLEHKCPHEALDGKDVCYWHEERANKYPGGDLGTEDFKNLDLIDANLQEANLRKANLQGANLDYANLQGADLMGANLQEANVGKANLQEADLYLTKFDNSNLWEAELDEIVIDEIHGDKEKDIEPKLRDYDSASQIYRNLKNYFRNEGIYERSGHYYYREKVVEKKTYRHKNMGKYLGSLLLESLCGYGEKPGRIIFSSLAWIFFNSFVYFVLGIEKGVVEIGLSLQTGVFQNAMNFLNCLYFSFVTFTTLGYGDLHPVGITKTFAAIEAFTGAFMLALFVLTMGRKMMR